MSKKTNAKTKRIDFSKLPVGTKVVRRDGVVVTISCQKKDKWQTWRVECLDQYDHPEWYAFNGKSFINCPESPRDLVGVVEPEMSVKQTTTSTKTKKPALPEGIFNVTDLVGKLLVIESDNNSGQMRVVGTSVSAGPFKSHADVVRHMVADGIETFEGSDRSSMDDLEHWGSDCLVVEVKRVVRQVPVVKVGCDVRDVSEIQEV